MGIFDRIKAWIRGKSYQHKTAFGVTVEMVGNDYIPQPPKSKRKLIQPDPVCPYCGFKYEAFPKDKKPCPSCGEVVIIKSRDKIKHLFTKARAQEWEDDKKERALINKARGYLFMGRVNPDKLQLIREGIIEKSGHEISYNKVALNILTNAALKRSVKKDFDGAFWTYFAMTHLLRDQGFDYFDSLQLMHEMRLREMKTKDHHDKDYGWKVRIVTGCDCKACKPLDGKILTLDEALETMPFPSKHCKVKFPFIGRYEWSTVDLTK